MQATVETKEITITTRVFTLEVTEEELRVLDMAMDRLASSYITRKNPALAAVVASVAKEIGLLVDKQIENVEEDAEEDDDDD